MSITKEDILAYADTSGQLDMYSYWSDEDTQQHNDHVGKTPMQMVGEFIEASQQSPDPWLYEELIREEFAELTKAFSGYTDISVDVPPAEELKELADLVYVCFGYAISMGWNLDEAIRIVHENNMGRMKQPDGTIKLREDGKVIKNPNYPKPNLSHLV